MSGVSYSQKTLVPDLVKALSTTPGIKSSDQVTISLDPSKDIISFLNVIPRHEFSKEKIISYLNSEWSNRVFLGTNGYYSFGDIRKFATVIIDPNNHLDITLPFYKVADYQSYLLINNDVLSLIIDKLQHFTQFLSLSNAYPQIRDLNFYSLLVKQNYPFLYDYIKFVVSDAVPSDKEIYTWWGIYYDLIKNDPTELALTGQWYYLKQLGKNRYFNMIATIRMLRDYPAIYDKLKNSNTFSQFYDDYTSINGSIRATDDELKIFYDYTQTGTIPEDYVFKFKDIQLRGNFSIILALMIHDGLKIESIGDLVKLITLTLNFAIDARDYQSKDPTKDEFFRFLRISSMSKDTLLKIISYDYKNDQDQELFDRAKMYIEEYIKLL